MILFRLACAVTSLALSALPAHACWETPSASCFSALWQRQALEYQAQGPKVERLYDLIDWGVVPPGPEAARALLSDLAYEDLVAYHLAEEAQDPPFRPAEPLDMPEAESALMMMLGYFRSAAPGEVRPDRLVRIYDIALQTQDRRIAARWYANLPAHLQAAVPPPDPAAASALSDPYVAGQGLTVATVTHLRAGQVAQAIDTATQAQEEPAFLAWRAIARHAIATDDMSLLARAVAGLDAALAPAATSPSDPEDAYGPGWAAPQSEFDALEGMDPSAYSLPIGARITAALAQRYLLLRTGQAGTDRFDAALAAMAETLAARIDDDDATPMLNARTALRLGLVAEADGLIDMTFTHYPGVPGFVLYDMPQDAAPWANQWLDRMITRYDAIIADPSPFLHRDYWSIWLDQNALAEAVDITRLLARYGRTNEAREFADRATAYLADLARHHPDTVPPDYADLFVGETAAHLLPANAAITRMRRIGMEPDSMAQAFAKAGRYDAAMRLVAAGNRPRNLEHWMQRVDQVPPDQRAGYVATITGLLEDESADLAENGYPTRVQTLHAAAAVFYAEQGDWTRAQAWYDRIADAHEAFGTVLAFPTRLQTLRNIAARLAPASAAPVDYPYEDFAL